MARISVLEDMLEPLVQCFNPESAQALAELRFDSRVQARVEELANKANEGELSEAERQEYDEIIELNDLIAILKLKTRRRMRNIAA